MIVVIILLSLAIALGSYALVSYRDRSLINILTPSYLILIPSRFVLELFTAQVRHPSFSDFAYGFVYATYALQLVAFALAYCCWPSRSSPIAVGPRRSYRALSFVLIFAAWVIYAPVLWAFRDVLSSPRNIYLLEISGGYGLLFFGSNLLAGLGFPLLLLWRDRPRGSASVGFIACVLLALLHGSKSQIMVPFFQAMLFYVYGRNRRVGLFKFGAFVLGLTGIVLLLLALTLGMVQQSFSALRAWRMSDLVAAIADYSDYNRNAMLVIDHHMDPAYGRLTYETQVYWRIPRLLFPGKPKNFGCFALAEEFYPQVFAAGWSVPDFGVGVQYADFGVLSILYLGLWAGVGGVLQRIFVDRFRRTGSPGDFIMLLFFATLPTMGAYFLPENLLLAALLNFGLRVTLGSTLSEGSPGVLASAPARPSPA